MADRSGWRWLGTAIAAGAVIAVLPFGVQAAFDTVVLKDPQTSSKARVTNGKLRVGDANGPLTVDGTVDAGGETESILEAGGLQLAVGGQSFPFDGSSYEQVRLSIFSHTTSPGQIQYSLQQTTPNFMTPIVEGTLSADDGASHVVELPGTDVRLNLYSDNADNYVSYSLVGR